METIANIILVGGGISSLILLVRHHVRTPQTIWGKSTVVVRKLPTP